ncbi:MAG: hypothetical protein AVDCRST_MAG13-873, partial [uncultured Solirubrobacteraceae bacterium]
DAPGRAAAVDRPVGAGRRRRPRGGPRATPVQPG